VSERTYGDFVLELDFKLGERGNGGCGLRFTDQGDPAFKGIEVQMVDPRYYPSDYPPGQDELSGSLYKAVAPGEQVYRPEDWNAYRITCDGPRVVVELNGVKVVDVNLEEETGELERGAPLRDRPRQGHLGFQELSRGGAHVMIRNARIRILGQASPKGR
jgi:hypothetical protein